MNRRPLSVTVIAWLYIVAGSVALIYHLLPQRSGFQKQISSFELLSACVIRLLAILAGVFLLRSCNWARWLAVAWMVYHVVLSWFHPFSELAFHAVFLVLIVWSLFHRRASEYFRAGTK
jgi:hypothetical protein